VCAPSRELFHYGPAIPAEAAVITTTSPFLPSILFLEMQCYSGLGQNMQDSTLAIEFLLENPEAIYNS
jgi:hypothetical protein